MGDWPLNIDMFYLALAKPNKKKPKPKQTQQMKKL